MKPPRRIVRDALCEEMSGLDRWTRHRLEKKGRFPKRLRLGLKAVGWFEDAILDWQDALARGEEWRDPNHDAGRRDSLSAG